jgi:transposase
MGEQEVVSSELRERVEQPCNVPAFETDVGEPVVSKERWEELGRMRAAGMTVSAISRATGFDRKTVRACLRKGRWEPYRRAPAGQTLLSPHRTWLIERAPQVNYSAQILFQELKASRGYQGGYDTVRNAVRPLRVEASAAALTQRRFETEPGQQAQVDWGQVRVRFASGPAAVHVFVMTLGYSRRAYAEGYENERMGALLSAHEHAFGHFGGRTAEILYDRMRTVTTGIVNAEGKPRWNPTFEAFARHWGFEPRLCRPYRAQTKGKVESGVKYVKRNFLPGRVFRDLADFNEQLAAWQAEVADRRMHGTVHEQPIERFAREAGALVCTLEQPSFYEAIPRERIVATDWLVAIEANRYSVPWRLIGKSVQVVRVGGAWHIYHQGALVAEHPVLSGRHQLSVLPEHGPGAAARNVRRCFSDPPTAPVLERVHELAEGPAVEVRELSVYEQMLEVA